MNRVREQCPKIDSGTVLSQTGSKQVECIECIACWPSSTPRPRARPRPAPACRAPPAPACSARLPCEPRAPHRVMGLAGHCITIQSSLALLSCHNIVRLYCNTNNPLLCNTTPPSLQYKPVYCNTKFSSPAFSCDTLEPIAIQFYPAYCTLYCNTMQPLQYIFPLGCNTIKPLLAIQSQPCNTIFFFHNIIWAVAQKRFLHYIFFFHLSFVPATGKYKKKISTFFFFFHFPEYSNKFLKIYFIHFL